MIKKKLLCILHTTPPHHGASAVGDRILYSDAINEEFKCKYIPINVAKSLEEIGILSLTKLLRTVLLFWSVVVNICTFKPDIIYFTPSTSGAAFYRDFIISLVWKLYSKLFCCEIYYHYHTRGISVFQSKSWLNEILVSYFVSDANVILLSQRLQEEFSGIPSVRRYHYLNNGIENNLSDVEFTEILQNKFREIEEINILFLSNMIKEKGYLDVLELACDSHSNNYKFHLAGRWEAEEDKLAFEDFISQNELKEKVIHHGFVSGHSKHKLLKMAHLMVFPTRYAKEAFPLVLLEGLSYGMPIVSTEVGGIPDILSKETGILIDEGITLRTAVAKVCEEYLSPKVAIACRRRYIEHYQASDFDRNLISILNSAQLNSIK